MSSKLKYHKDYTEFGETYQLVLPLNLEGLIPEDESVRLLSHELEELDYTLLYQAYSAKGRNPAVDPKIMFKILTYAYSQNIYSSRRIETACRRDINFMWLLAGSKAPDHSTIARFRTGFLAQACEDLFYQMVRRLASMGELSKETVFIDGTKLEACANKYTFVWKKSVGKWEEKMFLRIQDVLQMFNREYLKDFQISRENRAVDLRKIVDFLENSHIMRILAIRCSCMYMDYGSTCFIAGQCVFRQFIRCNRNMWILFFRWQRAYQCSCNNQFFHFLTL